MKSWEYTSLPSFHPYQVKKAELTLATEHKYSKALSKALSKSLYNPLL